MIVSFSKQFIFIHNPKCAGTSLREIFNDYNPAGLLFNSNQELDIYRVENAELLRSGDEQQRALSLKTHDTIMDAQEVLSDSTFTQFFKFGFVRNPWDREVSHYHFIRSWQEHRFHLQVMALNTFDDYVNWRSDNPELYDMSQHKYFLDKEGNLLMDYIGRYESLSDCIRLITQKLGISVIEVPHLNQSIHEDYRSHFTDDSADKIARLHETDIKLFNYCFENN